MINEIILKLGEKNIMRIYEKKSDYDKLYLRILLIILIQYIFEIRTEILMMVIEQSIFQMEENIRVNGKMEQKIDMVLKY